MWTAPSHNRAPRVTLLNSTNLQHTLELDSLSDRHTYHAFADVNNDGVGDFLYRKGSAGHVEWRMHNLDDDTLTIRSDNYAWISGDWSLPGAA